MAMRSACSIIFVFWHGDSFAHLETHINRLHGGVCIVTLFFLSTSSVSTSLTWHDHYVPRCCMWNGWSFNIFNGKEFLSPTLDSCNETFGDLEMKTPEDYMEHLQNQHDDEEPRVHESDASQLLASNIKNKHATKASVQFESIWGTWTSTAHHPTNISIS